MNNPNRAPDDSSRLDKSNIYRDTRRTTKKIFDDLPKWDMAIITVLALAIAPFYSATITWISLILTIIITMWSAGSRQNKTLAIKLPVSLSRETDYNDPKPGQKNKYHKASGTILLGNIQKNNSEVWITGKDLLTHMLLIGTTGAGKTETLISLSACTAFCMGGGIIFTDAKASPKLIFQFATLAKIFGRDDDVRIINYLTGDKIVEHRNWERLSNTTNPFAQGSANTAVQTLTGLLPSGGGDNQYFLDRAIAILRTLMPALVELRNKGVLNIYPSLIGDYISIKKFMELSENHIEVNGVHYKNVELSESSRKIISAFLKALPGFNPKVAPLKQADEVHRQFGFAEGYFSRTLANLAGTYGHIYETELAEADFIDIVMHNRILIVLVPAMEQAAEERSALGKIVLSSIRAAMAQGLGGLAEGDRVDVLESLPIDLKIPTTIFVDEYPEIAVEGFAVTATQGRGLGMSVIFAGQDLSGFVRASESEADMIFSNTRIKVLMAVEDPDITWRKFKELAGTMHVAEGSGWDQDTDGFDTYKTNFTASIREADRINFQDLQAQREGQAHIFEHGNIHRVQMFHHGISDNDLVSNFRINRLLKIKQPNPNIVELLQDSVLRNIEMRKIANGEVLPPTLQIPTIDRLSAIHGFESDKKWPWRLMKTLAANDASTKMQTEADKEKTLPSIGSNAAAPAAPAAPAAAPAAETPDAFTNSSDYDGMNIDQLMGDTEEDTPVPRSIDIDEILSKSENHWIFKSRIDDDGINVRRIFDDMVTMNTLSGQTEDSAQKMAIETIKGVGDAITYPSQPIESNNNDINDLWESLNEIRKKE